MLNDLGDGQLRHLASITTERWRQSRNTIYSHGETIINDGLTERGKGCKRDSSHLVEEDKESFFDCSICLELAKEPVLTCCGHLFCWACFYQVPKFDSFSKECPVCKGEVSDTTVTPIYGNGDSEGIRVSESGLLIPPRPKGRRVESSRQQQRVTQPTFVSSDLSNELRWEELEWVVDNLLSANWESRFS